MPRLIYPPKLWPINPLTTRPSPREAWEWRVLRGSAFWQPPGTVTLCPPSLPCLWLTYWVSRIYGVFIPQKCLEHSHYFICSKNSGLRRIQVQEPGVKRNFSLSPCDPVIHWEGNCSPEREGCKCLRLLRKRCSFTSFRQWTNAIAIENAEER